MPQYLPRRGCISKPRVAQRTLGRRGQQGIYPEGVSSRRMSCRNIYPEGAVSQSPGSRSAPWVDGANKEFTPKGFHHGESHAAIFTPKGLYLKAQGRAAHPG